MQNIIIKRCRINLFYKQSLRFSGTALVHVNVHLILGIVHESRRGTSITSALIVQLTITILLIMLFMPVVGFVLLFNTMFLCSLTQQ